MTLGFVFDLGISGAQTKAAGAEEKPFLFPHCNFIVLELRRRQGNGKHAS